MKDIMPMLCNFYECTDSHGNKYPNCHEFINKFSYCEQVRLAEFIDEKFILKSEVDRQVEDVINKCKEIAILKKDISIEISRQKEIFFNSSGRTGEMQTCLDIIKVLRRLRDR